MKTEDFSPKANLTKAGHGEAFADIARNTWSGAEKMNATPKGAGEAGTRPNEGTVTPKSGGPEIHPGGAGHEAPNGKGQGESAAGKNGGVAGGGGEFGKPGVHNEKIQQNGSSEGNRAKDSHHDVKPSGSDASGMPGQKGKPGAAGSDLNSTKRDQRVDSSVGYKLPDMVII